MSSKLSIALSMVLVAACEGDRGPAGSPGAPGAPGDMGEMGEMGVMGEPGASGTCAATEILIPGFAIFPEGIAAAAQRRAPVFTGR